jgi:ribosomal protein S6
METADKDQKEYELAVLVRKEEDLPAISALVKEHSGELVADFRAKRVALAYPIKKEKEAIFAYANFRSLPETAKTLEHDLNVRQDVLRSLITIPPKVKEKSEAVREMPVKKASAPRPSAGIAESKQTSGPLSNEALEKKIEEILK